MIFQLVDKEHEETLSVLILLDGNIKDEDHFCRIQNIRVKYEITIFLTFKGELKNKL